MHGQTVFLCHGAYQLEIMSTLKARGELTQIIATKNMFKVVFFSCIKTCIIPYNAQKHLFIIQLCVCCKMLSLEVQQTS